MLTLAGIGSLLNKQLRQVVPADTVPDGREIPLLTNDSRQVVPGALFAAIPGSRADGMAFVPEAVQRGAQIILSQIPCMDLPAGVVNFVVCDAYASWALLCQAEAGFPDRKLKGLAVTGTNGKTTSVMLWRMLLNAAGKSCGMLSTIEYDLGNGQMQEADRTTPEAARLFPFLETMYRNQLQYFAMEVSSHALAQDRIGAIHFWAAVVTNVTGDHLDYHRTMDAYYAAKRRLLTEHLAEDGIAVINADDPLAAKLCCDPQISRQTSFGMQNGVWRIAGYLGNAQGSDFTLENGTVRQKIHTNLVGLHNVYNLTGVLLALHETGIMCLEESAGSLRRIPLVVPGRLEAIPLKNGAMAFVDFAHTDDALTHVLETLRTLHPRRLLVVFGAGGDRDTTKRPRMGRAASEGADVLFVTSDNPRGESPEAIIEAVASGIPAGRKNVYLIPDRRAAIAEALQQTEAGDILLVAGKGHENTQEIQGVLHPFDDRNVIRELDQ